MNRVGIVGWNSREGKELIKLFDFLKIETVKLPCEFGHIKNCDAIVITPDKAFIDELILHYKSFNLPVYISNDYFKV